MIPRAAVGHYKRMQALQSLAVVAGSELWSGVRLSDLSGSWGALVPALSAAVSNVQIQAASAGASYGASTLAQQGLYKPPSVFVDPAAFGGFASDGRSLEGLLYGPVPYVKNLLGAGVAPGAALAKGKTYLGSLLRTQVADAGRSAAGVDTAARTGVGYVRMLNPPSCARCSILAGRFYKWNTGFSRHPKCDCVHVQTTGVAAANNEGLVHDPYEYFQGLSEAEQDRVYGKSEAQAVRDGGDIFQVVNARRGMKPGGLVTTEGTTRRGNYGRGREPRLTPEGIYSQNKPREETLRLLEQNGYILPGGQNPNGVIRPAGAGFSRETGLTAAERRAQEARLSWDVVKQGRNPSGGKLTPDVAARVEREFRKQILGY